MWENRPKTKGWRKERHEEGTGEERKERRGAFVYQALPSHIFMKPVKEG